MSNGLFQTMPAKEANNEVLWRKLTQRSLLQIIEVIHPGVVHLHEGNSDLTVRAVVPRISAPWVPVVLLPLLSGRRILLGGLLHRFFTTTFDGARLWDI
jgi:hypothetical protein